MAKIYSLNPGLNLRQVIPEAIYNSSENFVAFLKAYYEWLHTTEIVFKAVSGTFLKGEAILGQTSKNTATISYVKSSDTLVVFVTGDRPFDLFENIVGQTSGAVAQIFEIKDNVLRKGDQILSNRDVDQSIDIFTEYLKDELYSNVPSNYSGDRRLLAKKIRDLYQSKGHEQSYKFFMKLLYNQDVEISYPGDDVLKVSDGKFVRENVIRARVIGDPSSNRIFDFLFKTIKGRTSGSIANVIDIKKQFIGDQLVAELKLDFASGDFIEEETIYDLSDTSAFPLETTIFGIVTDYTIQYGGSGYVPGDILTVNGDGQEATLRVTETYTSGIDSIKLVSTGHGYQVGAVTNANSTGTGGSDLKVMVTGISNSYTFTQGANTYTVGDVDKVIVINTGKDYYDVPTIVLRDDEIYSKGMISEKNIQIVNGGNNYIVGENIRLDFGGYTVQANAEVGSVDLGVQSRTNFIRNSSNTANAVIGTPGTLPANWYNQIYVSGANTLATSVVSKGVENGLAYVDVRINGTTGTSSRVQWYFDSPASANSANGQHGEIWAGSIYTKLVSGSFANTTSFGIRLDESTSAGVYVTGGDSSAAVFPTSASLSSQRFSYVRTLSGGSTIGKVSLSNIIYFANNSNVDFTIRIAAPQLERNYFVTDYIPTTNTAVTVAGYGEPTRINHIRNSRAIGAIAGTPGTAPTNWSVSPGTTLSSQIIGTGIENDINYVDVRVFGTNSSGTIQYPGIRFDNVTQIAAVANSIWTTSAYLRRVAGTTANVAGIIMVMGGYAANGVSTNQYATNTISSLESSSIATNRRIVVSSNTSFSNTQTAFIAPWFQFQVANGNSIDLTIRIGAPQTEFGNTATSYIPTYNVAARRPSNEPTNDYNIYLENGDKLIDEDRNYIRFNTSNTSIAEWMGLGKISRVVMLNRGESYTLANLSSIIISYPDTLNGTSASLQVTGIMGDGANVVVDVANNTGGIGSIKKIESVNFGVDYSTANVSTVGVGNQDAVIVPVIQGSGITVGQFTNDDGKIDNKKIQDSYYYQQYSYVIKSGIEISRYREVLKKIIHPAGLEVFGEIAIRNNLDLRLKSDDPIRISEFVKLMLILRSIPNSGQLRTWSKTNYTVSADDLEMYKVADFVGGVGTVFSDTTINIVHTSNDVLIPPKPPPTIQDYKYYTFTSLFGIPIYFEVERQTKLSGTVTVDSVTRLVTGTGTSFLDDFASGDEFVVVDRLGSTGTNRFTVDFVASDTQMVVRLAHTATISDAEYYRLGI